MTMTPDGSQQAVVTIWRGGEWQAWGGADALYAQSDPDYLATIPVDDILAAIT